MSDNVIPPPALPPDPDGDLVGLVVSRLVQEPDAAARLRACAALDGTPGGLSGRVGWVRRLSVTQLHAEGNSYEGIAKIMGVTKARAYQIAKGDHEQAECETVKAGVPRWDVGWNSLTFLLDSHGTPVTPQDRHPQADPGPFDTWEEARASMLAILRLFLAAAVADPDGKGYHPNTRHRIEKVISDLEGSHEPETKWQGYAQTHAFWIGATYA